MNFKYSALALLVSSVAVSANDADQGVDVSALSATQSQQVGRQDSDKVLHHAQEKLNGVYIVRLNHKSGLDKSFAALGNNRKSIVSKIDAEQSAFISAMKAIDGNAIVLKKARLVDNSLHVQMNAEAAASLASHEHVKEILATTMAADYSAEHAYKAYPDLEVKDAGGAITVAIIGNGIDYTHASLGGSGTAEAYDMAWRNRSNAWDGFPTTTVIGGMDFSAGFEGFHTIDYNPIENKDDQNLELGWYPSGTAQAALVLEQAPEAKILAYKTLDWAWDYFYAALDFIVDPNQDGDVSDRPHIVVVNSFGNAAFYQSEGSGGSHATFQIEHLRRLSGIGTLVVSSAGTHYYDSLFNVSWNGASPEALTVGSVAMDDNLATLSPFTPAGPVRGSMSLKPEVVAPAEKLSGALVGTGTETGELDGTGGYAAAYTAGVAARAWAKNPRLSALEIKALVANTANSANVVGQSTVVEVGDVQVEINNVAEVPFMGSGLVDGMKAEQAKSVLWETSNYQPNLSFGFVETGSSASVTKFVTLKNLTDDVQSYKLSNQYYGDKQSNAAVSLSYPPMVSVPARSSVEFAVTLTVSADALGAWPISKSDEYSIENWMKATINGQLMFENQTAEDDAKLSMPWQVFPKSDVPFSRENLNTRSSLPFPAEDWINKVYESGFWVEAKNIDITNQSTSEQTYFAMPMIFSRVTRDQGKLNEQGNHIKETGASVYPNEMCASGQQLSVAVKMFDRFDLPQAEHFDKAGAVLTYFTIYNKEIADQYYDDPLGLDMNAPEESQLAFFQVVMNGKGQVITEFIDFSQEFEWWNPTKRYTQTSLDTYVAPGGDTVVVNACIDELYHHDFDSVDDWNELLGWQFATDRDAQTPVDGNVIRYNPVLHGDFRQEIIDHTGEPGYPNWWDGPCAPRSWNPDYCIEEATTFIATNAGIAALPADDDFVDSDLAWSKMVTLAPGESARVVGTVTASCNPNIVSIGNWETHPDCPPGVMYFNTDGGDASYLTIYTSSDKTPVTNQAFSVYENAQNGDVIGTIERDSIDLFYNSDSNLGDMFLLNTLPGQPFAVSTAGEITVINAEALDYENQHQYVLEVQVDHINRASDNVKVTINVHNVNDIAPKQVKEIANIEWQINESISHSIAGSFVDSEGDGVAYYATNLPTGVSLSPSGVFSGSPTASGQYNATIIASDGQNHVELPITFSIVSNPSAAPAPADDFVDDNDSSGSTAPALLVGLLLLLGMRRSVKG
ncbi:S8 family serine peptidase [Thalassotalea agarivorans]|uniref:Putative Ig domain-containing protein n=1 Tax=Thalassotalea agarivorans TaxID=349064 RepID=A0A1I0G6K5_THASX|nr:S8 family serine peptidase [Thalassotalea agarivorans]SET66420.1 Putative Ig domain-containing protein [Thalassotalea agarivorans]